MRFKLLFFLFYVGLQTYGQDRNQNFIKIFLDDLQERLPEDYDWSEVEEQLNFFRNHPIDLNNTTENELNQLIFLTPIQIAAFFAHLKMHGALIDVLELQQVELFDKATLNLLLPFVTIKYVDVSEQINFTNLMKKGNTEILIRAGTVLEVPKGFGQLPGSRYLGSREKLLVKYRYTFSNRVSAGVTLEKDAGERLLTTPKGPIDFQSAHLAISKVWKFEKIVIGDYTLQFGQGLTLWTGYAYGKAPDVASIVTKDIGLKAYTSANEYAFLRGAATTIKIDERFFATGFFSRRKLDASLDSNGGPLPVLSSIQESGLHRTIFEITSKQSIKQSVFGSAINYHPDQATIGAIVYHQWFDHRFVKAAPLYRHYQFHGNTITNVGFNFRFNYRNVYCFGEIGKSSTGGWAYLNGVLLTLSSRLSMVIVYRYYAKNYHNFFHEAMAESSEAINESGFYTGINIDIKKSLALALYADQFRFPWLKFRVDAPSSGYELLAQLKHTPNKRTQAVLKYKFEQHQQNTDTQVNINFLETTRKSNLSIVASWQLNKSISLQHRLAVSHFRKEPNPGTFGYLIGQDLDYAPMPSKISGNIRLAYFHTNSYETRIYAYEDDVLYNISFGMYNGHGWRTYANAKYKISKNMEAWARCALFFHPNTSSIGSGLDAIEGKTKTEIKIQLRLKF